MGIWEDDSFAFWTLLRLFYSLLPVFKKKYISRKTLKKRANALYSTLLYSTLLLRLRLRLRLRLKKKTQKKMVAASRTRRRRGTTTTSSASKRKSEEEEEEWHNPGMRREFASAFAMAFGMLFVPVQKKALSFVTSKVVSVDAAETLERTRGNEIFVALLFVNLQFYFGPVFGRFSKGSCNNPTVYVLRFFMGQISFAEAFGGAMVVVFAHVIAFMCYYVLHLHAGENILPAGSPIIATGSQTEAIVSEAAVAFLNFLAFDFALKTMPKGVQPVFGAFFYCFVITVEKCKYSCGYMNPAVVLSSHIVWGKTMKSKNVFSFERIFEAVRQEANRPYAYGAVLGSLMTAAVAKLIDVVASFGRLGRSKKSLSSSSSSSSKRKSGARPAETTTTTARSARSASLRKRK